MAALANSQLTRTDAYQAAAATVQNVAAEALTQLRTELAEVLGCSYVDIVAHPISSTAQLPVVRAQVTDAEDPQAAPLLTVDVTIQRVTNNADLDTPRAAVTLAVDVATLTTTRGGSVPAHSARSVASVAPATSMALRAALVSTARRDSVLYSANA